MLCGSDSKYFHDSCQALGQIHCFIDKNFPAGEVHPLVPVTFAGMETLTAETCIVAPRDSMTWTPRLDALGPSLNLDNLLWSLVCSGKYQFTKDNIVEYLEMVPDDVEGCVF